MSDRQSSSSRHGPATDEMTIARWLENPLHRRILIVSYFIYEPIRLGLTTVATAIVVFAFIPVATWFNTLLRGSSPGGVLPMGYELSVVVPETYTAADVGLVSFVVAAAIFVVLTEILIADITEFHRPISHASLTITYLVLKGILDGYSVLRHGELFDTTHLQTFRRELILEDSSPPLMIYYTLSRSFRTSRIASNDHR